MSVHPLESAVKVEFMESFLCGNPEASQKFYERRQRVIDIASATHDLCGEMLKMAQPKLDSQETSVIWLLGASCLREFDEIMLLAGNGFGTGATKLLRSFFERTITISYLATEEGEKDIPKFVGYSAIHWHQMLMEAIEIHPQFTISPEAHQRILDDYQSTLDTYKDERCPTCKRRPQMSWTKVAIKDMASKLSQDVRRLAHSAYLTPTFHLHTTHWGIVHECDVTETGKLRYGGGRVQEEAADAAFDQAFILLVQVVDVIDQYFELNMAKMVKQLGQDWLKASEAYGAP